MNSWIKAACACLIGITSLLAQPQTNIYQPTTVATLGNEVLVAAPQCNPQPLNGVNVPRQIQTYDYNAGTYTLFSDLSSLPNANIPCTNNAGGAGFQTAVAISAGLGGFTKGWVFASVMNNIYKIPPAGGAPKFFTTLPDKVKEITFDLVGNFGYQMVVSTLPNSPTHAAQTTNLYTINSTGQVSSGAFATVNDELEGMSVAPAAFGTIVQGDLIAAGRNSGQIYDISVPSNPAGTTSSSLLGTVSTFGGGGIHLPKTAAFVPSQVWNFIDPLLGPNSGAGGESGNLSNPSPSNVNNIAGPKFKGHNGQLLVTEELSGGAQGTTGAPSTGANIWLLDSSGNLNLFTTVPGEQKIGAFVSSTLVCSSGSGTLGQTYSSSMHVIGGGAPPYNFSLAAGSSLPPGLNLDPGSGAVGGTPTTPGSYSFTVQETSDNAAGTLASTCTINVGTVTLSLGCPTTTLAEVGIPYAAPLRPSGGLPPYTFSTNQIPFAVPGLSLDPATGGITGTPTTAGTFSYTAMVSDSAGATASLTCSITVNGPLSSLSCPAGFGAVGTPYGSEFVASGGVPPFKFKIASGKLPPGIKLNKNTGALTGTPTKKGTFTFTGEVSDKKGATATSAACGITIVPNHVLASCLPSSSLSVLVQGKNATAYIPNGSWSESKTGVQAVPLEGNAPKAYIPTGGPANACSSDWDNGITVCSGNNDDIYVISSANKLTATLKSGGSGSMNFSGGSCTTCGVAIDANTGDAWIETAITKQASSTGGHGRSITSGGVQALNIKNNSFTGIVPFGELTSENIAIDPVRGLLLSAKESYGGGADFEIDRLKAPTGRFVFAEKKSIINGSDLDATAEDCTTGIGVATDEFTSNLFITDLSQAVFNTSAKPKSWDAPSALVNFPEFGDLPAGTSGIAVAPGAHLGVVIGEFGGGAFGVFQLPSSAGSGTPQFVDYAHSTIATDPTGAYFPAGLDPHTVTAYVSPNTGKAIGVIANDNRTYIALVDIQGMLNAPRAAGSHNVDPSYDLVANGIITFASVPAPYVSCPTSSWEQNDFYSSGLITQALMPPVSYSVIGSLPPGLSLDVNGNVSGTPTTVGTYAFTIKAVDSGSTTTTDSCSVNILPGPMFAACTLTSGVVKQVYASSVTASGGLPPYTYSLSNGTLPLGLTLNTATGAITGTPLLAGTFTPTISLTDSIGAVASTSGCTIGIQPGPLVMNPPSGNGMQGIAYFSQMATGGYPPYTFAVTAGALPPGVTLTANGTLVGTPTVAGTYTFTITVTDSLGQTASLSSTVTVAARVTGVLSSCNPTSAVSVLLSGAGGKTVTAYVPNGSWASGYSSPGATGVQVVPLEGNAAPLSTISTDFGVNSCASNWVTGETVCTANNNELYLINGSTLTSTLTTKGTGYQSFSAGTCINCGVGINQLTNTAIVSLATNNAQGGVQFLNLANNTFSKGTVSLVGQTAESIALDPLHNLVLSPNAGNGTPDFQIVQNGVNVFHYANTNSVLYSNDDLVSGGEDCATGVALATQQNSGNLFLADLTQATFDPVAMQWNAPSQIQSLPEFQSLQEGANGIAVAGGSHLGIVTGAFSGSTAFGVIQLPATAGTGTPAIGNYVVAMIPNDPSGNPWQNAEAPARTNAYVSPNTTKAMGVIGNAQNTYLALVDLQGILNANRVAGNFGPNYVDPTIDLVASGLVKFAATAPPALGCPTQTQLYETVSYTLQPTISGGIPGYTYSIGAGALPAGMSIDPVAGTISGSPTVAGSFSYTIQVADSSTPALIGTVVCSMTTAAPVALTSNLSSGQAGVPYVGSISASGGFPPFTLQLSGSLPPGMTDSISGGAATFAGTPTLAGSYSIGASLTDASGQATTANYTIVITPPGLAVYCPLSTAQTGIMYYSVIARGGTGPYTVVPANGTLPPGMTANATGILTGVPTATGTYTFDLAGTDSAAGAASATSCTITVAAPDPKVLSSCQTANGLSVLAQGSTVTAYVPSGSWQETNNPGITVVSVEGASGFTAVNTPTAVNSCSSNWVTGQTVCTDNGTSVYLLSGAAITSTLTDNASSSISTGADGSCTTCNVAIDASTNLAVISEGVCSDSWGGSCWSGGGGIQTLDLTANSFQSPVPVNSSGVSAGPAMDPLRHLIIESLASWGLPIVLTQAPPVPGVYNASMAQNTIGGNIFGGPIDNVAGAQDCTTGIAVTMDNTGNGTWTHNSFFVFDMTQATFDPVLGQWNAPNQTQVLPEFDSGGVLPGGPSGVAMAPGTHVGLVTGQYCCGSGFGAIQLPATSGSGTPAIMDWVAANLPNDPSGNAWQIGGAPHQVTAYVSPNSSKPMGLMGDDSRKYVALVDINALLAANRTAGTNKVDPSVDLVGSGIVQFIATANPTVPCPAPADWYNGTAYSSPVNPSGGFAPFAFSITTGHLPTGLTIDPVLGTISGTPTVAGTFPFTIRAVDSTGAASGTGTVSCSMTINAPIALAGTMPADPAGVAYTAVLTASGGFPPYNISVSGLPSGVTATSNAGVVTISGTPINQASYSVAVSVADSVPTTSTYNFTFVVGPELVTAQCPVSTAQTTLQYYSQVAGGGVPPFSITPTGGLPPGLSLTPGGVLTGSPTTSGSYAFGLSVQDSAGSTASVSSCTIAVAAPDPNVLASCQTANAISVMAQGGNVTAYLPAGSWQEANNNIYVVPLEGSGTAATITTPSVVNSCASNWLTGQTVCTDNGTSVFLINGSTLTNTLTDTASGTSSENEGSCETCNVSIDAAANKAVISEGICVNCWNSSGAVQLLDLASNTFENPVIIGGVASPGPAMDPLRHLIIAGTDSSGLPIVLTQAPPGAGVYNAAMPQNTIGGHQFGGPVDNVSSAQDCSTGIGVTLYNSGDGWWSHNSFFVFDLTQASFDPILGQWNAVNQTQVMPEFDHGQVLAPGPSGIAIAQGTHLGIVTGEYCCGGGFGAFQMPATSGTGTPAVQDWVAATLPNDPGGNAWANGGGPHLVTAYVSPNTGKAMGVVANDARTYIGLIDIQALLKANRVATSAGPNVIDPTVDLVGSGILTWVPVP